MNKNKEKIYKEEIEPLVQNLIEQCKRFKMPMFVTICIDPGKITEEELKQVEKKNKNNTGKKVIPETDNAKYETKYISDFVTPFYCGENIKNDYIAECIKATNGFPKTKEEEQEIIDLTKVDDDLPDIFTK